MKTKNWVTLVLINLGAAVLVISPFLPGPPTSIVQIFYNSGQIIGLLGFFLVPAGLIWTIKEFKRKRNDENYKVDFKAVALLTLPLTIFISSFYASRIAIDFSRTYAIKRSSDLIEAIEKFKLTKGRYPDSLTELNPEFIPKIPSPFVMGIQDYYYETKENTYNISFEQNVVLSFNFEVVTFDPTDNQKADGKLQEIYDTGEKHWKYYIYD